jgi:CTD small phosphatase-like protein 2
LEEANKLF